VVSLYGAHLHTQVTRNYHMANGSGGSHLIHIPISFMLCIKRCV